MKWVRNLFLFLAKHNINLRLSHVPGKANELADALSRLQVRRFFALRPSAEPAPTTLTASVWAICD